MTSQNATIRSISHSDIDAVFSIEERSFSAPFTRDAFEYLLAKKGPFGGFVAEVGGRISGYLIYSSVVNEMELLTLAVDPGSRRLGIGKMLLQRMIDSAKDSGVRDIFLEVRKSNIAAQKLYSNAGFKEIGLRRGYYRDNGEDAITMKRGGHAGCECHDHI